MKRAVISLGTNTIRVLVIEDLAGGEFAQLAHRQIGTRLGEGLRDDGALAPEAMARTLAAVSEFANVAREFGASIACIATSAVRRASNAKEFGARVLAATGAPLRVLSGEEEAAASFRGATAESANAECATVGARIAVLDIGGGSTECAVGRNGVVTDVRSIEIGSVRVAERFPDLLGAAPGVRARAAANEARAFVRAALASLAGLTTVDGVRCVAGTPLTLGAVAAGSHVDRVSGSFLDVVAVDALLERLLDLDLAERRALPGMLAQRADIIVGGGLILSEALRALGAAMGLLESNDLLLGYLLGANGDPGLTE